MYDALLVAWRQKIHHNAIRPVSAIRYLYGNTNITAWGGSTMVSAAVHT